MERAAQLRAQGKGWSTVAEEVGLKPKTVRAYPSKYPPFEVSQPDRQGLVGWYREQLWQEEVRQLVTELQPAALDALLEVLEHHDVGSDNGPSWGNYIQAARAVLKSTGFEQAQKTRRKLEAQEDVTGEPGDRVNVHEADQFDQMDDDQIDERIDELESIVKGDDGSSET